MTLDETRLSEDVWLALDKYATDNSIGDRQEALRTIVVDSLIRLGYLPHEPQEGTRPEDLTTDNDD